MSTQQEFWAITPRTLPELRAAMDEGLRLTMNGLEEDLYSWDSNGPIPKDCNYKGYLGREQIFFSEEQACLAFWASFGSWKRQKKLSSIIYVVEPELDTKSATYRVYARFIASFGRKPDEQHP